MPDINKNEDSLENKSKVETPKVVKKAKKATTGTLKQLIKKLWKTNKILFLKIVGIALLVLMFIGLIGYFIFMPGLIVGKIGDLMTSFCDGCKAFAKSVDALITGDTASINVHNTQAIALGQYCQDMGYDLVNYGLANASYDTSDNAKKNIQKGGVTSKRVKKIRDNAQGINYLYAYAVANESGYTEARNSAAGYVSMAATLTVRGVTYAADTVKNLFKNVFGTSEDVQRTISDEDAKRLAQNFGSGKYMSTGMVWNKDPRIVYIFDKEENTITAKGPLLPSEGIVYDIDSWYGRYTKPKELLLTLHLSTMMPDLVFKIAQDNEFNTKIKINGQYLVSVYSGVRVKKDTEKLDTIDMLYLFFNNVSGNSEYASKAQVYKDNKNEDDMVNLFLDYINGSANKLKSLKGTDDKIPGSEYTTNEILEIAQILEPGMKGLESVSDLPGKESLESIRKNIEKGTLPSSENTSNSTQTGRISSADVLTEENGQFSQEPISFQVDNVKIDFVPANDAPTKGFRKFPELTDAQIRILTLLAMVEEDHSGRNLGSVGMCLSHMIFNYEYYHIGKEKTSEKFYNYVNTTPWYEREGYANVEAFVNYKLKNGLSEPPKATIEVAKKILREGYSILPNYINEYDYKGDILKIKNPDGTEVAKNDHNINTLIPNQSKVFNGISGKAWYTFYSYTPNPNPEFQDVYGYTVKDPNRHSDFCFKILANGKEFTIDSENNEVQAGNGETYPTESESDEFNAIISNAAFSKAGRRIYYPIITGIEKHWFYEDIDFSKDSYRLTKAAKKVIEYKPSEKSHLKDVDLQINTYMGPIVIYQVSDPEVKGPRKELVDLFKEKYFKYDGTYERALQIENARANLANKYWFRFYDPEANKEDALMDNEDNTIEDYDEDSRYYDTQKMTEEEINALKEYPNFDNAIKSSNGKAAIAILENMKGKAAEDILRDVKKLMLELDKRSSLKKAITPTYKKVMLWPVSAFYKNEKWNTIKTDKDYGEEIATAKEDKIIAPTNAVVKSVSGDELILTCTDLSDEYLEFIKEIRSDEIANFEKDVVTGIEIKLKNVKSKVNVGQTVEPGEEIGEALGNISIILQDTDKSVIENLDMYMPQSYNDAYKKAVENQKNEVSKEGIDLSNYLYIVAREAISKLGNNNNTNQNTNQNTNNNEIATNINQNTQTDNDNNNIETTE